VKKSEAEMGKWYNYTKLHRMSLHYYKFQITSCVGSNQTVIILLPTEFHMGVKKTFRFCICFIL